MAPAGTRFSLPTQRCFHPAERQNASCSLFSAYAEVFPTPLQAHWLVRAFLCLRRGVSGTALRIGSESHFSLPTQRCFLVGPAVGVRDVLFSAYAEVFPHAFSPNLAALPFLCLRRGVSIPTRLIGTSRHFSLPTQRCFQGCIQDTVCANLFSAYAEVFRTSGRCRHISRPFLCLRRGVSSAGDSLILTLRLFSAYAEVFLTLKPQPRDRVSFLCLRRGVSSSRPPKYSYCGFSLPTQRCFPVVSHSPALFLLFSAYAEVFLQP